MTKVLILAGGDSNEREVSLRSGAAVQAALQTLEYAVTLLDTAATTDFDKAVMAADVVVPMLHGSGGEDGQLQARLGALGARYVGSGQASSELCFDKWRYRQLMAQHNVLVATGELVDQAAFVSSTLRQQPYVLKPYRGGSSIDTIIAHDPAAVSRATTDELLSRYDKMLLERLVAGTEITVAVLGETALPVIEIIPPAGQDFDYENKYNGASQELCPPLHIRPSIQLQAQDLALKVHQLCDCRDLSRTDMIVTPHGELVVLETNTLPGMTNQSLVPRAAAAAGIPMAALCDRLVQMALQRSAGTYQHSY